MVSIQALGSSSAGNSYMIDDGRTKILLEAGLKYRDIQRGVDFRMSEIEGCLISHEHGDHSRSARDVMKAGVDVYASRGTLDALGLSGHRAHILQARQTVQIGTWHVMAFETQHDAAEAFGFLIGNDEGEKICFLTDTYYVRYTFKDVTRLMVECNFSERILDENIAAGRVPHVLRSRLIRSHFSLERVKEFLRANEWDKLQEVYLLHLSDSNSDEELFKREVQALTGVPVTVCDRRAM